MALAGHARTVLVPPPFEPLSVLRPKWEPRLQAPAEAGVATRIMPEANRSVNDLDTALPGPLRERWSMDRRSEGWNARQPHLRGPDPARGDGADHRGRDRRGGATNLRLHSMAGLGCPHRWWRHLRARRP